MKNNQSFEDICRTIHMLRFASFGPPHWVARRPFLALVVCVALGVATGYHIIAIAGLVPWFLLAKKEKFKSWDELLYHKLANYTPENIQAYKKLINKDTQGSATSDDLLTWLGEERRAIELKNPSSARRRFWGI